MLTLLAADYMFAGKILVSIVRKLISLNRKKNANLFAIVIFTINFDYAAITFYKWFNIFLNSDLADQPDVQVILKKEYRNEPDKLICVIVGRS